MSTGVPSAMYGMSSTGTIFDTTPLLPWRPAILSPGCRRRLTATYTLTIFCTPGGSSSPCVSFCFFCSNICVELDAELRERFLHRLELARRILAREADVEPVVAAARCRDTPS